jgi:hypothetical protein
VHAAALSTAALVAAQPRPSWRIRYNGRVNGHVRNGDKRMLGRLQKTAILLAIGVFFATTISAEIFDASNRSHAAINQKTPKPEDKCTDHYSVQECTEQAIAEYNKWLTIFTAILAVATAGLGFATVGLYFAGERQLKLARAEFIATHRPKTIIHAVEVTRSKINKDHPFIGASILAFNAGESVAKNVEVRGQIFMGPNFAIDVQRPIVKTFAEVLSGQKLRAEVTSEWQASDAAAGARTGIVCYCIGWIAYWDENAQRRETGFCFQPKFGVEGDRWVSADKPEHEYEY